jgi:17beta-estradiol 17-dehydrogenase/3alpha(17beta)-hydroxysteroid dehydrogenase (NAD+)
MTTFHIIGGGSSVAQSLTDLKSSDEEFILYSREKPLWLKPSISGINWQKIEYSLNGAQNANLILEPNSSNCFILAASPLTRKLLINYPTNLITSEIESGIIFPFVLMQRLIQISIYSNLKSNFIFLSSTLAINGQSGAIVYNLTKASIESLSKSISKEYGNFGIRSNVIRIGFMDQGMGSGLPESKKSAIIGNSSSRKSVQAPNLNSVVRLLNLNADLNGIEINLDAGLSFHI